MLAKQDACLDFVGPEPAIGLPTTSPMWDSGQTKSNTSAGNRRISPG